MLEEIGVTPDGNGGFMEVSAELRRIVCKDKSGWLEVAEAGDISIEKFDCQVITERITPPQSPTRFQNTFFHVALGESGWRRPSRQEEANSIDSNGGGQRT